MIKTISSQGKHIWVNSASSSTYVNSFSGAQGIGNMRFNTSTQNIEVYDGNTWIMLNMGHVTVGLHTEAENIIDWAKQKRDEEYQRMELAKTNPVIKDLVEQIKQKEEQIKMVQTLLKSPGDEIKPSMIP